MTQCIEHNQAGGKVGYGLTTFTDSVKRGSVPLHRAVYMRHHGLERSDIAGLHVRHTCDNPRCINIEHLVIGTAKDNGQDKVDRNRQARGEGNGRAIVSKEQAEAIRNDPRSQREIGRVYGIGKTTVAHIKAGRSWPGGPIQ